MSGVIAISFVEFPAFSFDFERVRCASLTPFLVRNWCGRGALVWPHNSPVIEREAEIISSSDTFNFWTRSEHSHR
jgi:hypothetical protein